MRCACWVLVLLCAGWAAQARAGIVIYRCTDAFGRVTVQNDVPCPKGSREQKQVVEPPPPLPAYQPAPAVVVDSRPQPTAAPTPPPTNATTGADAAPAPAVPLPPPPLYRCRTPEDAGYFGENATPPARCVALPVVGLDGQPSGAGTACQVVRDTCERIPDDAACAAWQQYAREAEAAWRFGRAEDGARHQAEFERIQRVLRESTCAQAGPAP
ncbi:MAG: DUF4124 domain-containing protein [Lysobacteraceae bacterium]